MKIKNVFILLRTFVRKRKIVIRPCMRYKLKMLLKSLFPPLYDPLPGKSEIHASTRYESKDEG